jgi:hypothetical protein
MLGEWGLEAGLGTGKPSVGSGYEESRRKALLSAGNTQVGPAADLPFPHTLTQPAGSLSWQPEPCRSTSDLPIPGEQPPRPWVGPHGACISPTS